MPLVVVESPLRGKVPAWCPRWLAPLAERVGRYRNRRYALRCVRDSLLRGEAPYASHVLFDQHGLLNDAVASERDAGMFAGFAWGSQADVRAVYVDHGVSTGMRRGIKQRPPGQIVEFRRLSPRSCWRADDVELE